LPLAPSCGSDLSVRCLKIIRRFSHTRSRSACALRCRESKRSVIHDRVAEAGTCLRIAAGFTFLAEFRDTSSCLGDDHDATRCTMCLKPLHAESLSIAYPCLIAEARQEIPHAARSS